MTDRDSHEQLGVGLVDGDIDASKYPTFGQMHRTIAAVAFSMFAVISTVSGIVYSQHLAHVHSGAMTLEYFRDLERARVEAVRKSEITDQIYQRFIDSKFKAIENQLERIESRVSNVETISIDDNVLGLNGKHYEN